MGKKFAEHNFICLENTLRLIALSTEDELIRQFSIDVLEETEEQIREKINNTCFGDSDNLRQAIQNVNEHNRKSR